MRPPKVAPRPKFIVILNQGRNERGQWGHNSLRAESLWGDKLLQEAPKSPNNVTSTFFNTANLLLKELSFDRGGAKLAFCPGRHLTTLFPCS